jgi:hypothetical protein
VEGFPAFWQTLQQLFSGRERWSIKINEDETRAIYFSHGFRPPETHLTLKGWNICFLNHIKYLGVIFDKRIKWRLHIEMIEAKAFRTFIRIYSLFKSERSSASIKLTLHKALIRSVMTYACPTWELATDANLLKLQCMYKKVLHIIGNFPRCTVVCDLHTSFQPSICIRLYNKIVQATIRSLTES